MNKIAWIITLLVFGSIITVFVLSFTVKPDLEIDFNDDGLKVKTFSVDEEILFDSITEIYIKEDKLEREKKYGFSNKKIDCGVFSNDDFGDFCCYIYKKVNKMVVIKYENKYLVINQKDNNETIDLYNKIKERVK